MRTPLASEGVFPGVILRMSGETAYILYQGEGTIQAESIRRVISFAVEATGQAKYVINDLGSTTGMVSEARSLASQLGGLLAFEGMAVCGGRLPIRAFINLMLHGLVLIGKLQGKVATFETVKDAERWVGSLQMSQGRAAPG